MRDVGVVWIRGEYTSYTEYHAVLLFAAGPVERVAIDIRPGSCPNGRLEGVGRVPVAILGNPHHDLLRVELSSVRLAGSIVPLHSAMEDVSGPPARGGACDCDGMEPDRIPDLMLHFDAGQVGAALDPFATGPQVLRISGLFDDGTPFEGEDCVVLHEKGGRSPRMGETSVVTGVLDRSRVIAYGLPTASQVRLVTGRCVPAAPRGWRPGRNAKSRRGAPVIPPRRIGPGSHSVDGCLTVSKGRLSRGVHWLRLRADDRVLSRRWTFLR